MPNTVYERFNCWQVTPYWCRWVSLNSWTSSSWSTPFGGSVPFIYSVKCKIHTANSFTPPCVQHEERVMWWHSWSNNETAQISWSCPFFLSRASLVTWVLQLEPSSYEPLLWFYSILVHLAFQFLSENCWSRDSVVTCRRSRASVTRFSTLGLSYGDVPPGERVDHMSEDH